MYGYYRANAKRFPYSIFYEIENNKIYIMAILDARRDPKWIKKRLDD